jgi:putative ABC transport system permease protein
MTTLFNDIKYAIRQLIKSPVFTAVAVLTLALGIGANTSMFTTLRAALMRPLPYAHADRLVRVFCTSPHSRSWPHSVANFLDYKSQNDVFQQMAAFVGAAYNFAEPGQPARRLRGLEVTADMFPLLEAQPQVGRPFIVEEERPGQNEVAILSHAFWQNQFAGDTNILGRTLRLDGKPVTIVGVMPDRFNDTRLSGTVDVWRPLVFPDAQRQNREWIWLQVVGRLKPGVSLSQAQAGMDALSARLAQVYPKSNSGIGLRLMLLANVGNENRRQMLWLAMGLAGFVLLIACANLANLQLARIAGRTREVAVRSALGANRRRLSGQLLSESLLIALLGGLLGLLVAKWGNELLSSQMLVGNDGRIRLNLGLDVLGFAFVATTISGLVFGLVPAWMASGTDVNEVLKQGARGSTSDRSQHRLRHALVVLEMALALVLLAGAGVVVRGLHQFASSDPGWQVDGLTLGYLTLPDNKYGDNERRLAFARTLQEKLSALPGFERVALARELPLRGIGNGSSFVIEGRPEPPSGHKPLASINSLGDGYFETLGIPLVAGRRFTVPETSNSPAVVIINETMACTFWPGESAIGRRIGEPGHWREIVGVVGDVCFPASLDEPQTKFQTYRPFTQEPSGFLAVAVRGNVSPETLQKAVAELDSDLPLNNPSSARAAVERSLTGPNVLGKLLAVFAAMGLLLAAMGIYGVMAGFVAHLTGEIGVRIAVGAQLKDVLWLVIDKGLRLTVLGVATGSIGAFGVARALASISPELKSKDPFTFLFVTSLLAATAVLACWIPARRAVKIDPMEALRYE